MIFFDLEKENPFLLHCEKKRNFYYAQDGILSGKIQKDFPDEWTMMFSFCIYKNYGNNALIFEFGSYDERKGFGLYINQNKKITFRFNDNYNNYDSINITILPEKMYDITIIQKKDGLYFFVNGIQKFFTKERINHSKEFGAFNRIATYGSKDEWISGYISDVLIYDEIMSDNDVKHYFEKLKRNGFLCPNCNSLYHIPQFVLFNPRPRGNDVKTDESTEYNVCLNCKTIYSSEMMNWTPEKFSQKCYNDVYVQYDPDFISPNGGRTNIMFNYVSQRYNKNIFHLDYGSGEGFLTKRLNEIGYMNSYCYDPFHHPNKEILNKKFDLITCVEVVEHSYNINEIFKLFCDLLNPNGELIITTLFHNQEPLDDWWYCAPRVGHILFFEEKGFCQFALKYNFFLESIKPFQGQKIIKLKKK